MTAPLSREQSTFECLPRGEAYGNVVDPERLTDPQVDALDCLESMVSDIGYEQHVLQRIWIPGVGLDDGL